MVVRGAAKPGLWTGVDKLLPLLALGWALPAAAALGEPFALPSAREPQAVAFGSAAGALGLAVQFSSGAVAGYGVAIAPRAQSAAARASLRRCLSPRDRHRDFGAALSCVVMLLPLPPPSDGLLRFAYFMLWVYATRLQASERAALRRHGWSHYWSPPWLSPPWWTWDAVARGEFQPVPPPPCADATSFPPAPPGAPAHVSSPLSLGTSPVCCSPI